MYLNICTGKLIYDDKSIIDNVNLWIMHDTDWQKRSKFQRLEQIFDSEYIFIMRNELKVGWVSVCCVYSTHKRQKKRDKNWGWRKKDQYIWDKCTKKHTKIRGQRKIFYRCKENSWKRNRVFALVLSIWDDENELNWVDKRRKISMKSWPKLWFCVYTVHWP